MRIPLALVVAVLGLAAGNACVEEGAGPGVDTGITSPIVPTPSATVEPVATPTATATSEPSPTSTPTPTATPTPLGISAGEVLEASAAAMKALAAFHFDMNIVVSVESEDSALDIPIVVSGDFQAPDRLKASFLMDLLLLKIETEIVSIGDTEYVKDPATGEWQMSVGQGGLFTNPGRLVELAAGDLQDLALVGTEVLEGIEVYHLTGAVGDGSLGFGGQLQLSLWIRTDDGLVARVTAEGDIALDEAGGDLLGDLDLGTSRAVVVLTLSEFGKEVYIVAPIAGPSPKATGATASPPAGEPEQQAALAVDDEAGIVQRVKAAMDAVGSTHFEGTIAVKASESSETALFSMQIKGDSADNNDSSVLMTVALDLGGFTTSIAFETREVWGVAFTKDPLTNQWQIDE